MAVLAFKDIETMHYDNQQIDEQQTRYEEFIEDDTDGAQDTYPPRDKNWQMVLQEGDVYYFRHVTGDELIIAVNFLNRLAKLTEFFDVEEFAEYEEDGKTVSTGYRVIFYGGYLQYEYATKIHY